MGDDHLTCSLQRFTDTPNSPLENDHVSDKSNLYSTDA